MPTWPLDAPQYFLVGSLQIAAEPNLAEFRPDVGSPIRRERYTEIREIYSGEMLAQTLAEMLALRDFWKTDCSSGALPFDRNDWLDEITPAVFEWVGPPAAVHIVKGVWRIGVQVAKIPSGGT